MTPSNLISLVCLALIVGGVVGIVVAVLRRRSVQGRPGAGSPASGVSPTARPVEAGLTASAGAGARSGESNVAAEELELLARQRELKELLRAIRQATAEATQRLAELEAAKAELGDQAAAMEEYLADLRARHDAAVGVRRGQASAAIGPSGLEQEPPGLHLAAGETHEVKPRGSPTAERTTAAGKSAATRSMLANSASEALQVGLNTEDARPTTSEVLRLASEGRTSVQIARELGLQPGVVELMLALRGRK